MVVLSAVFDCVMLCGYDVLENIMSSIEMDDCWILVELGDFGNGMGYIRACSNCQMIDTASKLSEESLIGSWRFSIRFEERQ